MKKVLVVAVVLLLAAGIVGGTAAWVNGGSSGNEELERQSFGASDAGKEVEVGVGDLFTITLESNITTGFQWQLASNNDESVLELADREYKPSEGAANEVVGAGGEEVWTFKALSQGKSTLVLEYSQPWEGGMKADKTFTLTVVVE